MSLCMTPAGVKYVTQVVQCMTPAGVKHFNLRLQRESSMSICLTPAGVKYFNL